MSLEIDNLKTGIEAAFKDQQAKTTDADSALQDLASKIASAIDSYVRGIEITYTSGLADASGPVTGAFGNSIS